MENQEPDECLEYNENNDEVEEFVITEQELKNIQRRIHDLNKQNQIKVLKILNDSNSSCINENKYGVFVNLTELPVEIILKLKKFLEYNENQEFELSQMENQKNEYKNKYFSTDTCIDATINNCVLFI